MEARRRALEPEQAAAAAQAVVPVLLAEPRLQAAPRVALYAALVGELPTRPLLEALAVGGRTTLLPRLRGDGLEWAEASDWGALEPGARGVLEPAGAAADPPRVGDLVLLPGLAFDRRGGRLGRGGGHYDRAFPPGAATAWLVGVGYAFQVVESVPRDERDRRVDAIVSEAGIEWIETHGEVA